MQVSTRNTAPLYAYSLLTCAFSQVTNAYVSGMKEDLDMSGNDLNYLQVFWTVGYIVGQLPSQIIITKIRPSVGCPRRSPSRASSSLAWPA